MAEIRTAFSMGMAAAYRSPGHWDE